MLVWLAMVTGARRGELCALRWDRVDFTTGVLQIRTSIAQQGAKTWEKDTKTHHQRRITLDPQTLALLRSYHAHRVALAAAVGIELPSDARLFSPGPDGSVWVNPDTVGQRYARMCARLGWDMHLHQLRHYSATKLISAGVDVRTVAGRQTRAQRRWDHNTEGLQRVAIRGGPARGEFARHADAGRSFRG